jgi:hypothetical protein
MRVSTNIIENSMEVLQKFKTKRIAIWLRNCITEYISVGNEIRMSKEHLCSHSHCNTMQNSEETEPTNQLTSLQNDESIKKMWYIYKMEFYSIIKGNGILSFCHNIDRTGGPYRK